MAKDKRSIADKVRDAITHMPKTALEIVDETGVSENQVRIVLGIAQSFEAVTAEKSPRSKLLRYRFRPSI